MWVRNFKVSTTKVFNSLQFSISKTKLGSQNIGAIAFVKRGRPLLKHMINMIHIMGGNKSPNWVRTCIYFLRVCNLLYDKQGAAGVVKYLKAASVILQQVCAGHKLPDMNGLGVRISRSKSGLPRIIPAHHRKMIMQGDSRVIKWYLTFFSLYRDIFFVGNLKLSTITNPSNASGVMFEMYAFIKAMKALYFHAEDLQFKHSTPLNMFYTAGPQTSRPGMNFNSSPASVLRSKNLIEQDEVLLTSFRALAQVTNKSLLTFWDSLNFTWLNPGISFKVKGTYLGKLHIKEEAAGKVRVFAMVDPWTQWVLKPLHQKLFDVLKRIPSDGTFNQLKPLKRIPWGEVPLYSFDLSAATDRLPLALQIEILNQIYGSGFGTHWGQFLVHREYQTPSLKVLGKIPIPKDYPKAVKYACGQPMGALSSWAMLALTHHFIVHYCAWISGVVPINKPFTQYAVLGDDIVIWNKTVAKRYLSTLKGLGVEVGLAKSVLSPHGEGLEFAKRTIIHGKDVSPIPFKEQCAAHRTVSSAIQFQNQHGLTSLELLRFLGYGYRVNPNTINRVNIALNIARLIPTTVDALFSIFIKRDSYFGTSLVRSQLMHGELCSLLQVQMGQLIPTIKDLSSKLSAWFIGEQVNSIGPWKSTASAVTVELNKDKVLKDLADLDFALKSLQLSLPWVTSACEYYSSWISTVAPLEQYPFFDKEIPAAANHVFNAVDTVSKIQVDHYISPHLVKSASDSPSMKESRAKLKLWNRWSNAYLRTNMPIINN